MATNVEMVVSPRAEASVRAVLGAAPWARLTTTPSRRAASRLVVDCLDALVSPEARNDLERTWRALSRAPRTVPVVFLASWGSGKSYMTGALLQALLHWSHIAKSEPFIAPNADAIRRMVLALQSGAEKALLASAAIEDGNLVVWSCEPKRYEVAAAKVPVLARISNEGLGQFDLSASGSRIHWPVGDVDISLDTIREYADPKIRQEHESLRRKDAARYADAIRRFREERRIKQSQILGLSERQVRRLEQGDTIPHSDTLTKLAVAHEMPVEDYLAELAKRSGARP